LNANVLLIQPGNRSRKSHAIRPLPAAGRLYPRGQDRNQLCRVDRSGRRRQDHHYLAGGAADARIVHHPGLQQEDAEELKAKLKRDGVDWKKAEASTVHAIGLRNYRKSFPKNRVVADKVGNITSAWCESGKIGPELMPHTSVICKLVSLAKQNAFGIIGDIEDTSIWTDVVDHFDLFDEEPIQKKGDDIIDMAIEVLKESNQDSEIIDFDDMIYLPLLYRIKFWQYDNVLMDEAQDANIVRKLMADALLKEGGRFFGIGDPCQPAGTQVSTPVFNSRWKANEPATVAIEALKVGDKVVSYEPADSAFVMNGRNVSGITVKGYDGRRRMESR
jgi:hypothetical protein